VRSASCCPSPIPPAMTFDNPPINLIDPVMVVELDALLT
jgi:hypothetical protein